MGVKTAGIMQSLLWKSNGYMIEDDYSKPTAFFILSRSLHGRLIRLALLAIILIIGVISGEE